jgi:hypothetical protein
MFTKRIYRVLLIAAIALLAVNISPGTAERLSLQPMPAPAIDPTDMGTAFTYQGRLMDGANPANGVYDFQFSLYDDASTGTLIGTDTLDDHTVTNGLFMGDLDFGAGAFPGFERWLEIGVRDGASSGSYTVLSPRQQINPAPYATFARTIYRKTVVVKPVGNSTLNGTELLNAMASISGASSNNRYLLKIEPGIYDIGSNSLVMQPYVDVEGSGQSATRIESTGSSGTSQATVIGCDDAELRSLTVRSDAGNVNNFAIAMLSDGTAPTLIHVTLEAFGGVTGTTGLDLRNGANVYLVSSSVNLIAQQGFAYGASLQVSTLEISDSTISSMDAPIIIGIYNSDGSDLAVIDSHIIATASSEIATASVGIWSSAISSTLVRNSRLEVQGNDENGVVYGLRIDGADIAEVYESTIEARKGFTATYGISISTSAGLELSNSRIDVYGNSLNFGIFSQDTPLTIRDDQIFASGFGINTYGIEINDGEETLEHEISQTHIEAATLGDMSPAQYIGVRISSDGRVKFFRDTIRVQPAFNPTGIPQGGWGIYNNGATVTFENSTINSAGDEAFVGIQHLYYTYPGTFNTLYVNNSEIYTCPEEPVMCNTIAAVQNDGLPPFQGSFVYVGSSLLWGGMALPPFPITSCIWVHDEIYNGFGWPAMGPIPFNFFCP